MAKSIIQRKQARKVPKKKRGSKKKGSRTKLSRKPRPMPIAPSMPGGV